MCERERLARESCRALTHTHDETACLLNRNNYSRQELQEVVNTRRWSERARCIVTESEKENERDSERAREIERDCERGCERERDCEKETARERARGPSHTTYN